MRIRSMAWVWRAVTAQEDATGQSCAFTLSSTKNPKFKSRLIRTAISKYGLSAGAESARIPMQSLNRRVQSAPQVLADATPLSGEEKRVLSLDFCQELPKHLDSMPLQTV